MSFSMINLHTAANSLGIIQRRSASAFWQRFQEGVNLTYYSCTGSPQKCFPPLPPNRFRFLSTEDSIEHVRVPETKPSIAYVSSLATPIFSILAERVNASIEVFVSTGEYVDVMASIEHNLVTSLDRVPVIYTFHQGRSNQTCLPPLFLYGQLQILSARLPLDASAENIFTTFSVPLWLMILSIYVVVVALEVVAYRSRSKFSATILFNIALNYFKPIVAKEAQTIHYTRILFISWLLGVFPLVEIFRNDMIAKIVEVRYRHIDSIEELLAEKELEIFNAVGDRMLFNHFANERELETGTEEEGEARRLANYKALLARSQELFYTQERWLDAIMNPRLGVSVFRKAAIIEDENALDYFEQVLDRFMTTHRSKEIYMPSHITPTCFMSAFPYKKEIEKLGRELFEKGFYQRWQQEKADYLIPFGMTVLKMIVGTDPVASLRAEAERVEQTSEHLFYFVIKLYLVLTIVNISVFVLEIIYFFCL